MFCTRSICVLGSCSPTGHINFRGLGEHDQCVRDARLEGLLADTRAVRAAVDAARASARPHPTVTPTTTSNAIAAPVAAAAVAAAAAGTTAAAPSAAGGGPSRPTRR